MRTIHFLRLSAGLSSFGSPGRDRARATTFSDQYAPQRRCLAGVSPASAKRGDALHLSKFTGGKPATFSFLLPRRLCAATARAVRQRVSSWSPSRSARPL